MTAQLPDPRDFKSWEDAFSYPLPAVRKLEQQLRSNAVDNREKLRSLVGYVGNLSLATNGQMKETNVLNAKERAIGTCLEQQREFVTWTKRCN
jgi:hypothetical protein